MASRVCVSARRWVPKTPPTPYRFCNGLLTILQGGIMQSTRLILIEFNELCPHLLQRFMDRGLIPNFRSFYESSTICTTDAGEDPGHLEPWIQWPTVHSGMSFHEHGVFHLGDGCRLEHK